MVSPETPNSAIKQVIRNLLKILMGSHEQWVNLRHFVSDKDKIPHTSKFGK
jgi:hypothetical protein